MRRRLVAGNWKMNGTGADLGEVAAIRDGLPAAGPEVLLCPPATLISRMAAEAGGIALGGQDCHAEAKGAHTGDVSAAMLKDAGADWVILGHSERRTDHEEEDEDVRAKGRTALDAGLKLIVCVGESGEERAAQNTLDIIGGQLAASIPDLVTGETLVVAYEPIWAIGTGKIPTMAEIAEVHGFIRSRLERRFGAGVGRSVRLLYGGSVKPGNAAEIFAVPDVDGALVGGASLKAADFLPIVRALAEAG